MNCRKAILITVMFSIVTLIASAQSSTSQTSPVRDTWVMKPTHIAVTPPLYTIKSQYVSPGLHEAEPVRRPPVPATGDVENFTDPVLQTFVPGTLSLTLGANYDGVGENFTGPNGTYTDDSVPPDTDVAVGTTQVVSLDNSAFAIFSKSSGAILGGPYNTNTLWLALGSSNDCYTNDDGDGVVKFDQLAQRWIITQFQVTTSPFHQCVAVSLSADATGSWTVFEFVPNAAHGYFPDYPKLGVWPNVYSMTFDLFNSSGTTYEGGGICGINRAALLAGTTPTIVCASLTSSDYALLPVDLDGANYPPAANTNALYIEQSQSAPATAIYMYSAAYNFTAGTVAVGSQQTITVGSYNWEVCGASSTYCVVQPTYTGAVGSTVQGGTFKANTKLDTLEEHMMFRAAYRNFGSYESITLSQTVLGSGTSQAAQRWYEIRSPFGTPTVYQQSTWSPDTSLHRWMGSIAQDHQGNMALGYSGSDSAVFPSVYVTGRLSSDTLSTMESEIQLYAGLGQQVALQGYTGNTVGERWGDYSAMMPDVDDCTFWYTGEYLKQVGSFNWSTRILSFSFPSCTSSAAITLPVPKGEGGTALTSGTATFYWMSGTGSPSYTLSVGSTQGGSNYCSGPQSYPAGTYKATLSCLPTDGSTFWVRLTTVGGAGGFNDYQYTSPSLSVATTTSISSTLNPSTFGQSVAFVATVTSSGNPVTSGTVQFVIDSSSFGTPVALNGSGQATSNFTSSLSVGGHAVVANYSGASGFSASTSSTLTQNVNQATQTITFQTNAPASAAYASQFTVAATGGGSGNPLVFTSAGGCSNTGATYKMTSGTNSCSVIVNQAGNANYMAASQVTETTNATVASSGATIQASPTTASQVDTVTLTATVTGAATGFAPTGTVTFYNGATSLGSCALGSTCNSGPSAHGKNAIAKPAVVKNIKPTPDVTTPSSTATLTVTNLPLGMDSITASYSGDGNYNTSTSTGTTVNVIQPGLYSPTPSSTLTGTTATFQWTGFPNATAYWLDVGASQGSHEYYSSGSLSTSTYSQTVNSLPTNGQTIYVTLYDMVNGSWVTNYYTYTAFGSNMTAMITSPTPSTMLTGTSVTFTWSTASGAGGYWLDAGSSAGAHNYYSSGNLGTATSTLVTGLPSDASMVYVTMYTLQNGNWLNNAYTYTAFSAGAASAMMTSPMPGSTLISGTVTFNWTAGMGAAGYWVDIGSGPGGHDIYSSGNLGLAQTLTVNGLPTDGSTIYVTLYTLIGGNWISNAYTYTTLNGTSGLAAITSPTPSTTLSGNQVTFNWSSDSSATGYWLDIGTAPNGNTIYSSGNLGTAQTTTVSSLPADGSTIYVTLYSLVGGQWLNNSYMYVSGP